MPPPTAQDRASLTRDCFVARQPIFDTQRQVHGYELLFRSGPLNQFAHGDGDEASRRLIGDTLSVFGLDVLTVGKKAFINFTREVLLDQHAYLLPPEPTVVEVLETVVPDAEVVEACRGLKQAGYQLAMDDYVGDPNWEPLVELADLIKVDFRGCTAEQRAQFARRFRPPGIQLIAEKVETWEEWREGVSLGYSYFQGYFFCRPETLSRKTLPLWRTNYLRLLGELNRTEVDFDRIEQVIKQEACLALKLLSYMNSALFGCGARIKSIKHAAIMLGPENLRRWANLTAVLGLCDGKPPELFLTCVVRARFCELLGRRAGLLHKTLDLFLTGLLSLIDAILDRPLEEALSQFAVPNDIRAAILRDDSPASQVCSLARAYENGDWERVGEVARSLNVPAAKVAESYRRAIEWSADTSGVLSAGPD
jgi:EAL and modified HD-GYP domain-containing signal transduction protein